MKKLIVFFICAFFVGNAMAQLTSDTLQNNVVIVKDARIDILTKKKAEINKKASDSRKPTKGYRIQVLNTSDREQALSAKAKLLSQYPEHKTYLMYQAPYFKIRIGNFIDKKDADDLKRQLSRMFPTGVFVIPSDIEVRLEKDDQK